MARQNNRKVTYWRDNDRLIRSVVLEHARAYAHSCTFEIYKEVAYAIEEASAPTTLSEIADQRKLPFTQVNVALEFFKERGLVERVRRRSRVASKTLFEDAMTEFYALTDEDRPQE